MLNSKWCFERFQSADNTNSIDPAKIRRQRMFWPEKELEMLRKVKGEHYATISYPDRKYIDHVTLESSTTKDVTLEILSTIIKINSLKTLAAVVCD